jgi:hypothetical protein
LLILKSGATHKCRHLGTNLNHFINGEKETGSQDERVFEILSHKNNANIPTLFRDYH